MSDTIKIIVNVDDAKALTSLTNLEAIVKRINSTPLNIPTGGGSSSGGRGSTAGALKDINVAATNLDTRLANLSNSVKNASDSGKYAEENFSGLSRSVSSAKTQLTELTSQYKSGKISQEEYAAGVKKISAESGNLTNQFANLKGNIKETSGLTKILGDSLGNVILKMGAWQLAGAAVSAAIGAVKDGLQTIKEVDSEIATIRKVTGMSKEEADELAKTSYSTASKYGVEASEYLANVATFARAGYGKQAEALGELAIKTQLVGDVNQETASQCLLAADAAWKMNGNVEQLSLVLDKANEIDNNYATSIQKIAEGFPIVANVAAMAGMSVDQTMAALGTITATTQESGTKAATALRALILNILGDTTTEISEGVTATEESVNSLGQILKKYAPDAVAAAEATGKLINPMEAIEALSKAAKDGLLSEADLMSMVSALGGKLRTNQLLALLENFDMYTDMLDTMTTAFGSADKEYQVLMDTWESKTNVLKNTWTEFLTNFVNTDTVKSFLDMLTQGVETLGSVMEALGPVFTGINEAIQAIFEDVGKLFKVLETPGDAFVGLLDLIERIFPPLEMLAELIDSIFGTDFSIKVRTINTDKVQKELKEVQDLSKDEEKTVSVSVNSGNSLSVLDKIRNWLNGLTDKTINVGVNYGGTSGGGYVSKGRSSKRFAKGGKGGGWAVVNDERTDGSAPELILDGDRAYIANDGKPAMVHLSPNATVLTADQTKDALSSKATEFPRFAGGWLSNAWNKVKKAASNAYNNAINYVKSKLGGNWYGSHGGSFGSSSSSTSSSGRKYGSSGGSFGGSPTPSPSYSSGYSSGYSNGYSDGYSSGGYSGYSDSGGWGGGSSDYGYTGTAAQEKQTDPLDELSKEISDTLKNLDSRITLAQNQKNVTQEQSLQNEAISYLNSAISRYNVLGKGETSTEVTDLRNKIYSYQKAHDEAPVKALEDKISKYLENINAQIEKANNEGNTDQADLLRKQAMEAIKGYEGEYNALGYGNTSTEVLDLLNKSYDYQQDIRDALQSKIDDYLGNIDKQISLAASNDDDEKVKALRDQAMSAITGFVQDWKNLGLKEDSDEIIDLLQKSNDYKEAIIASFKESLSNQLSLIDAQIALAQNQGNTSKEQELNGDAIKAIFQQIKDFRAMGYGDDSPEILELKNKAFGYGGNVVGGIVEILQAANDAADKAKQYADLQKEIQEKQEALENAKHQRTVRYFNSETGQWEWMEDEKQIQQAQDDLKSAQDELEQLKREALINYVEKIGTDAVRNSVESGIYDPDGVLEKLGVVSARLAESVEQAKLMPSVSNDSHDIIYRFGNLQLTPGQAHDMTVEELINEIDKYNLT
nr:MAG TPA: minor tail protein [Caudoviricetes sp.]